MKSSSQALLDLIPDPKSINARATFRLTRPTFTTSGVGPALATSTKIDSCEYGTGILRVVNYNNYLYTQEVSDIHSSWPAWVNTGIALVAGSTPACDDGVVWYQKSRSCKLAYRDFSDWSTELSGRDDGDGFPETLAPISNKRCYSFSHGYGGGEVYYLNAGVVGALESFWTTAMTALYGVTAPRIDAVCVSETADSFEDYVYFTDRDAGRIIEMRVVGEVGTDKVEFGQPREIIAIDAIDEVYGLNLNGASVIDGKVVVTGRLTRTSDGDPVSMDVYTLGPNDFSFGRDMFISENNVGGKMLVVGNELVVCGNVYKGFATGTNLFGIDDNENKLVVSDIGNVQMQETENRSSTVTMSLSPALAHAALSRGAQVTLEFAYNDEWLTVLTGEVSRVSRYRGEGESLTVYISNATAKRLSQWSPDQGIYIPSQACVHCDGSDLSQVMRAEGKFASVFVHGDGVMYDDTDANWHYNGTGWGTSTPAGAYNNTIHYSNSSATDVYASFDFEGTGFIFFFTRYSDRGGHEIWIDGEKVAVINAYELTSVQGQWTSPVLAPGAHTFKLTHEAPTSGYIDVDAIEIFGNEATARGLTTTEYNKLSVVYTAARAARGGIMRGTFLWEGFSWSTLNMRSPRFGVGLNYYRETKAEAAARLGIDYTDVDDDMCGHNGIVAIWGADEDNYQPGVVLYKWENSVLTRIVGANYFYFGADRRYVKMQMRFIEGRIDVWLKNGDAAWAKVISYTYDEATLPWVNEQEGRGCIVMEKHLYQAQAYHGFAADDMIMGVYDNAVQPIPNKYLFDDEIIHISDKSLYNDTNPSIYALRWQVRFHPRYQQYSGFDGNRVVVNMPADMKPKYPDGSYGNAALCTAEGHPGHPKAFKVVAYDRDGINVWIPSIETSGWSTYIGQTGHGYWGSSGMSGIYVEGYPYRNLITEGEMTDDDASYVGIFPSWLIDERGMNGTIPADHGVDGMGWAYLVFEMELYLLQAEYFTQDEDIMLTDALRRILRLAGGNVTEKYLVNGTPNDMVDHGYLGSDWQVLDIPDDRKDFIAEIDISPKFTYPTQVRIGIGFYGTIPLSVEFDEGFYVCVEVTTCPCTKCRETVSP